MSLATKEFLKFREKALATRKEKYAEKHNLEVATSKEIAE
jgi:hypothetical protein